MLLFASSALFLLITGGSQAKPLPAVPPAAPAARSAAYYHFSLAQQARMAGRFDEALDEYRKAQKDDPGSGAIRAETARLLREAGRLQDALSEAREATRVDPKSSEAQLILGQLYLAQAESEQAEGPLRQAAAGYEKALQLDPDPQTLR